MAKKAGFGFGRNYAKAKYIGEKADKETIKKLDAGELSIHRAYQTVEGERGAEQGTEGRKKAPAKGAAGVDSQIKSKIILKLNWAI